MMLEQTRNAVLRMYRAGFKNRSDFSVYCKYNKKYGYYEDVRICIYLSTKDILPYCEALANQEFCVIKDIDDSGEVKHISVHNNDFAGFKAGKVHEYHYQKVRRELNAKWKELGVDVTPSND